MSPQGAIAAIGLGLGTGAAGNQQTVKEGLQGGTRVSVWATNVRDAGGGARLLGLGERASFEIAIDGFVPGTRVCSPIIAFGDGVYRLRIAAGYVDASTR